MKFGNKFQLIPLADIHVERDARQRREVGVEELAASIKVRGLMNPIIVRSSGPQPPDGPSLPPWTLVAGERRLEATRSLGHETILARQVSDLNAIEHQLLELEENIKREDLSWQDRMNAFARIDAMYRELDAEWTQSETAGAIGIVKGMLSENLTVHVAAFERPELLAMPTLRVAYNAIKRTEQRQAGKDFEEFIKDLNEFATKPQVAEQQSAPAGSAPHVPSSPAATPMWNDKLEPPAAASAPVPQASPLARPTAPAAHDTILNTSFLDWAPAYAGDKFNLIHCDFPYGIGVFSGVQGRAADASAQYDDSPETYFALLDCLLRHFDRFATHSVHLVFWYSAKHESATREKFRTLRPDLDITPYPLVWGKSDGSGIIGDARRDMRHCYETALFARRGGRMVVKSVSDFIPAPSDRTLHASVKPEPVLKHFLGALVDNTTRLLDPTCGSGSAIRAAEAMGAEATLGLEIDPQHCEIARTALRNARSLRKASEYLAY